MGSIWEWASRYAEIGYRVVPIHVVDEHGVCSCGSVMCQSPGKHPRTVSGVRDASSDPKVLRRWQAQWRDRAWIGVAVDPTWVVIDVDPRNGGESSWQRIARRLGLGQEITDQWPRARTGGGGWHWWLRLPDGVDPADLRGRLADGVDVKKAGGYVVAPPSGHASGGRYNWEVAIPPGGPGDLPEVPQVLLEALRKKRQRRKKSAEEAAERGGDPQVAWWAALWRRVRGIDEADLAEIGAMIGEDVPTEVLGALIRDPEPAVELPAQKGRRHDTLVALAGVLRRAGAPGSVVDAVLAWAGQRACTPPLEEREVIGIVASTEGWQPDVMRWPRIDVAALDRREVRPEALDVLPRRVLAEAYQKAVAAGVQRAGQILQRAVGRRQGRGGQHPLADAGRPGGTPIRDIWPDAPVPGGAVVPTGWVASEEGAISRMRVREDGAHDLQLVSQVPIVLSRVHRDVETGEERVVVAWREETADGRQRWQEITVAGHDIASTRRLPDLARWGLPVTSATARGVMDWLAACRSAARLAYAPTPSVSAAGWAERDGVQAYVLGDGDILGRQEWEGVEPVWPAGLGQVMGALMPSGEWEEERRVWQVVADRWPHVWAVVCAGLSAALLDLIDSEPWVLHLYGPSGSGKSTALRLAAGAWGQPGGHGPSLLRTWDTTTRYVERLRSVSRGVPMILDDTAQVPRQRVLDEAIYAHATGMSRGRAARGGYGVQEESRARTVLLSTGEGPLGRAGAQGGVLARVIDVGRPLWGRYGDAGVAAAQREALRILRRHHGHLAREVVRRIAAEGTGPLEARWDGVYDLLIEDAAIDQIEGPWRATAIRWAHHLVPVVLAGQIAVSVLGLEPDQDPVYRVCLTWLEDGIGAVGQEGTPSEQLLRTLVERVLARVEWIWDAEQDGARHPPSTGWVARMDGVASGTRSGVLLVRQSMIPVILGLRPEASGGGPLPGHIRSAREDLVARGLIRVPARSSRNPAYHIDGIRGIVWEIALQNGEPVEME